MNERNDIHLRSKAKVLPVYATNQDVVHANLLSQLRKLQALNYQSAITPHESPQELFIASSAINSTFTKKKIIYSIFSDTLCCWRKFTCEVVRHFNSNKIGKSKAFFNNV